MTRYLKLIWFFEGCWTKYHAAIGIDPEKTVCGITRSTRPILPSEELSSHMLRHKCSKCLAALRKRFGTEDIVKVRMEA